MAPARNNNYPMTNPSDLADAHARPASEILTALDATATGLTSSEATARLARHGPNSLPGAKPRPAILRLLAQFNNALIYFMLAGAGAAAALGHYVDAGVILAVVIVNAIVGFLQEGKAESALNAIRDMIAPQASVLRDGRRISVGMADLVPGDVVLIEAGDRVPADLRLISARNLLVNEAILTGESMASTKGVDPVAAGAALGDRRPMAFSGTLVAAGQGSGVVTATGTRTQIGRISTLLREVEPLTTPLLRQINAFAHRFTLLAFVGAALIFAFAVSLRGYAWDDALMAVVALAVGLVPEGLPAVITITLAIGVQRMAARRAVIRRLPAVETLGATSIICSDKTGTLTRNEMTVGRVVTANGVSVVQGAGYDPTGHDFTPEPTARGLLRAGLLCNDAELNPGTWKVEGDPMEGALIAAAMKAGLDPATERAARRLDAIPFDAQHRFMATLHDMPGQGRVMLVKGAPERILAMCARQASEAGAQVLDHAYWSDRIAETGREGERVLGYATKPMPDGTTRIDFPDVESGLTFLGITGFIDPPRPEAVAAIAECHRAGIDVRMITGDHAETATAIARQLGLAHDPQVLTGKDLDTIPDSGFADAVARTQVFARTSPEHKLRIVRALQSRGNVVAMTGDGVNDAPSLKQADVGIAMGIKGTEETQVMLALANSGDLLTESLRQGEDAWKSNSALAEEAQKRYETAESQIAIAWNKIKDAAIDAGGAILPVVADVITIVGDLAAGFADLPDPVQKAVGGLAAVAGVSDDFLGEAVKAFVVLAPGSELGRRDILLRLSETLEDYMLPRIVEFCDVLPKTASGKVRVERMPSPKMQGEIDDEL